jgi:hypothetical protein
MIVLTQVYMYYGAAFPALAKIAKEGFGLSACRDKLIVLSNRRYIPTSPVTWR